MIQLIGCHHWMKVTAKREAFSSGSIQITVILDDVSNQSYYILLQREKK